mmetsp:Transcript_11478/g.17543  ORF Transcript_11478/g.17543 Transcript_11478/m.17543 type:complete len:298 (-) Transcript_11478:173-1066(-)|eukprot:CAMPEP_0201728150 /NCGR_PEP_ID=MMETSP0593-20130828/14875_1 /ASSEMBLY_ACC=CAM_ASM_000672 /TAXON_ID=267983 /ORGANISM="Skeletonema japonicum, Strain CCMP2506" /LENGTH=297 /DNA_ID=CAMNT_0048220169 /DNA_START=19 /DNA_END=912 /DNA_ORIENTATION=+
MVSLLCFRNKKKNNKKRKRNSSKKSSSSHNEDRGLLSSPNSHETQGIKTLSSSATKDTALSGIGSSRSRDSNNNYNNNYNNFDDSSIPTIDSDYNPHNSNFSLSDAGGTIGSRSLANVSHATSAFGGTVGNTVAGGGDSVERRLYNDVYMMSIGNNGHHHHMNQEYSSVQQLSHLIQPPTSHQSGPYYTGSTRATGGALSQEETTMTIHAPTGKLGVVIDTPTSSQNGTTMPIVHAVKDSSPLAKKIQVGDKLIMVDEEDVTSLTALQVSKLLARKSGQSVRKLTIVRTARGRGGIY